MSNLTNNNRDLQQILEILKTSKPGLDIYDENGNIPESILEKIRNADPDLIASNIASGIEIFGITGTFEGGVTLPTLTNPASASHILSGKQAIDQNGNKITGTIATRTSSNLTASGATVIVPAGYYASQASKSVSTTSQVTPTISVNTNTGVITASATQSAGYISGGTKTATQQLSVQGGGMITPKETSQTAVTAGKFTTGAITVAPIPSDYIVTTEVDELERKMNFLDASLEVLEKTAEAKENNFDISWNLVETFSNDGTGENAIPNLIEGDIYKLGNTVFKAISISVDDTQYSTIPSGIYKGNDCNWEVLHHSGYSIISANIGDAGVTISLYKLKITEPEVNLEYFFYKKYFDTESGNTMIGNGGCFSMKKPTSENANNFVLIDHTFGDVYNGEFDNADNTLSFGNKYTFSLDSEYGSSNDESWSSGILFSGSTGDYSYASVTLTLLYSENGTISGSDNTREYLTYEPGDVGYYLPAKNIKLSDLNTYRSNSGGIGSITNDYWLENMETGEKGQFTVNEDNNTVTVIVGENTVVYDSMLYSDAWSINDSSANTSNDMTVSIYKNI